MRYFISTEKSKKMSICYIIGRLENWTTQVFVVHLFSWCGLKIKIEFHEIEVLEIQVQKKIYISTELFGSELKKN